MIIFIGNLPPEVTADDLASLGKLYAGMPVRIHKKQDGNGGLYRYGLVHLNSEKDGRKLIRRLHGSGWHGRRLVAREFGYRRAGNERRRLDWRSAPWHGHERRKGERRAAD